MILSRHVLGLQIRPPSTGFLWPDIAQVAEKGGQTVKRQPSYDVKCQGKQDAREMYCSSISQDSMKINIFILKKLSFIDKSALNFANDCRAEGKRLAKWRVSCNTYFTEHSWPSLTVKYVEKRSSKWVMDRYEPDCTAMIGNCSHRWRWKGIPLSKFYCYNKH